MARTPSPNKYACNGILPDGKTVCNSTNLRFRADGKTYHCFACGHNGDKEQEMNTTNGEQK